MLKKTDEFSSVFSFRKRFSSPSLVVHYKPNQLQEVRIGFVVAKKVAKRAVDRNYMRRVLREFCRNQLPALGLEAVGTDAIIQVKKKFERKDFTALNQELEFAFGKIKSKVEAINVSTNQDQKVS